MKAPASHSIRQLSEDNVPLLEALLPVFGRAFEDDQTYGGQRPAGTYLRNLLASETFIAIVAQKDGQVVGGLVAYELRKFEQERSEVYIYDLAVALEHRREGIATALIEELERVGFQRGAYVLFVQADPPDAPAIALYSKLGKREDVLHFDIPVRPA